MKGRYGMIDFIFAGIICVGVMFVVFFCLAFVTIGIFFAFAALAKRCVNRLGRPNLAMK